MDIKAEFIVGKQTPRQWSGVYGYVPEEKSVLETRGSLCVVISLKSENDSVVLEHVASFSLDELQRYIYEEDFNNSYLEHLEEAMFAMKNRLLTVVDKEESLKDGVDFEMAVGIYFNDYAYFASVGEAGIYLLRNENLVCVSDALIDSSMQGFFRTGSLMIEPLDTFLLCTSKFVNEGEEVVRKVLKDKDLEKPTSDFIHKPGIAGMLVADIEVMKNFASESEDESKERVDVIDAKEIELEKAEEHSKDQLLKTFENTDSDEIKDESDVNEKINQTIENDDLDDGVENKKVSDLNQLTTFQEYFENLRNKLKGLFGKILPGLKNLNSIFKSKVVKHFKDNKKTYAQFLKSIYTNLITFGSKVADLFKREVLGVGYQDRRNAFDRAKRIRRNRRIFAGALVILIIFTYFFISRTIQNNKIQAERREIEARYQVLQSEVESLKSEALATKNQDVDKKVLVLNEIDKLTKEVEDATPEDYMSDAFSSLNEALSEVRDDLLLIDRIREPQVIADFGAVFEDVDLRDIAYSNGGIFVSDYLRNVVYKLSTNLSSEPVEHISNLVKPEFLVTSSSGDLIVYDNDEISGIARFSPNESNSLSRFSGLLARRDIGSVAEVGLYLNTDGLYELKTSNEQIYKREKSGDTYLGGGALFVSSNPPNWKNDPELSRAIDIAVPFEIYVLIDGGGIRRYLGGGDNTLVYESFVNLLRSDFESFKNASSIDVSSQFMAVSDPQNRRVMIFQISDTPEKFLTLVTQFVYDGTEDYFNNLQEVVINEIDRQVYVLDGEKVIRLDF
ncbi:MAG: hypothetical protein KatS3mg085_317 [Candidatus Dojkabacteria bacterium]|nr:MAG: hypothetical protein KatS3mg085_317 [Candidatus Dojkabacteria bacterium]